MPRAHLLDLGHKVGIGDLYIESWRPGPGRFDYGMKAAKDPTTRAQFIALNRGRLGSNTRGFWRDGPGGRPLRLRQAASTRRQHETGRTEHYLALPPAAAFLPTTDDTQGHVMTTDLPPTGRTSTANQPRRDTSRQELNRR